jgi:hypothetical protein
VVYHSAGWLEGGLTASYEKFVMDCETLQQVMHYMRDVPSSDDDLAVEAIREVGPTGHFFGAAHTQARYETAFYAPFLSDWRNYERWSAAGAEETPKRANRIWKQILAEFEPPPIDFAVAEELRDFVERRKREGGAPTDLPISDGSRSSGGRFQPHVDMHGVEREDDLAFARTAQHPAVQERVDIRVHRLDVAAHTARHFANCEGARPCHGANQRPSFRRHDCE